ncbi:MAG TPA: hypothetical protein VK636_09530 [Gemmatimonadaceae bacterium]|nr:hypothetical protein [Gemmatimonadaceae bacterium]
MSRFIFAALASFLPAAIAAAQHVPGRDLLEFPLGLMAEAPPLSSQMTGGLWNPANIAIRSPIRAEIGFAGLTTPQEQGVRLEMLAGSYKVRPNLTASLSYAQASVSNIIGTDTDPTSNGGGSEIPYSTMLVSAGAALTRGTLTLGAALRYRYGTVISDHGSAIGIDGGAIVDRVAGTPLRLAVSTFLLTPSRSAGEATYLAAADVPVFHRDSSFVVRGGYSISHTEGRGREDYAFASSAYRQLDVSGGVSQMNLFGNVSRRMRLGFGLRYAGYTVAVGREDGAAGISASYQFLVKRTFR